MISTDVAKSIKQGSPPGSMVRLSLVVSAAGAAPNGTAPSACVRHAQSAAKEMGVPQNRKIASTGLRPYNTALLPLLTSKAIPDRSSAASNAQSIFQLQVSRAKADARAR